MGDEWLIRPATAGDISAIHAIYGASVLTDTASWELTPPDEGEVGRRMQTVLDGGYPYFVAELAGRVVGYSYASSFRPRLGYRFTVEDSVYVADGLRGRGVGRQLLTQVILACEKRGFRQMLAIIGDSENLASINLHSSLGFAQVGLLRNVGYKFGRWLDIVIMQRPLGAGATTAPSDR
jgi:phosphinothricin acetyltransferase